MKNKIFIITNENIYLNKDHDFYCDNIDLKSIPEELDKFFDINIIGRRSSSKRSKKINLKKINTFNNFFSYMIKIIKSLKNENTKYLIISLSPYTFLASIFFKIFSKHHVIYLRSDGYKEYKFILGLFGPAIYHFIFSLGIIKAKLIACRKHLLRNNEGIVVNPSQLNKKWFKKTLPNSLIDYDKAPKPCKRVCTIESKK